MLVVLLIGLSIALLGACAIFAIVFLDVAFAGPPVAYKGSRQWHPPLLRGNELLAWATDTANTTTTRRLAGPHTADTVKRLVTEVYEGAAYAISHSPNKVVQRQPDCPSCRQQMIGVTPPEAVVIADTIRRTKTKRDVQRIHDRLARNAEITATMTAEQYQQSELVCPLLENNDSCAIFAARPIRCRGWCLMSGEDCSLRAGNAGPLDDHAYTVGCGTVEGLSRGLKSAGLDGTMYELNSALIAALDTPLAAERWASGDPVFERCKRYR
jgi:hypothetical protein